MKRGGRSLTTTTSSSSPSSKHTTPFLHTNINYSDEDVNNIMAPISSESQSFLLPPNEQETKGVTTPTGNNAADSLSYQANQNNSSNYYKTQGKEMEQDKVQQKTTFWSVLKEFVPRWEIIKEEGAMGRNLMASERTMLAWIRTSISCIALGIAITKLVRSESELAKLLLVVTGTIITTYGLLILFYGCIRFTLQNYELRRGRFTVDKVSSVGFMLFGFVVCFLAITLMFI